LVKLKQIPEAARVVSKHFGVVSRSSSLLLGSIKTELKLLTTNLQMGSSSESLGGLVKCTKLKAM